MTTNCVIFHNNQITVFKDCVFEMLRFQSQQGKLLYLKTRLDAILTPTSQDIGKPRNLPFYGMILKCYNLHMICILMNIHT